MLELAIQQVLCHRVVSGPGFAWPKPPCDNAVRDAIRKRMSPPNRESVAEIARTTGITTQTLYNWRSHWQKEGQLVPATSKAPEQWSAADKLAAVIQATGLSGPDLGAFCRERGLYPKQLARWRQAAEDANGPSAPSGNYQERSPLEALISAPPGIVLQVDGHGL